MEPRFVSLWLTRYKVQRLWGRQKPNAVLSELDAEGIFRFGGRARGKGLWRIADWWWKNHDPVPRGAEVGVAAGYIVCRYGFVDARSVSSSAFGKKWQQVGSDLKRALGQLCTDRIDCADRRSLLREDNRRLSVEWELFSLL